MAGRMPTLNHTLLAEHAQHTLDGVTERAFHLEVEAAACSRS